MHYTQDEFIRYNIVICKVGYITQLINENKSENIIHIKTNAYSINTDLKLY